MKKVLLIFILSFLVFLNVRLWGVREAEFLIDQCSKRRSTCDLTEPFDYLCVDAFSRCDELGVNNDVNSEIIQMQDQDKEAQSKMRFAHIATYIKHKNDNKYVAGIHAIEQDIDRLLIAFSTQQSCNEFALQQLIDLLTVEINLVTALIYPTMGSKRALIRERKKLIEQSIPSVQNLYTQILDYATHSNLLQKQYADLLQDGKSIILSLKTLDKKIYLHILYQRLVDSKQKIQNMQYQFIL